MSTSTKAPSGSFTILYFASIKDYTEKDSEHLPAPLQLPQLFRTLEEKYNGLKAAKILESCLVTVNLEYVDMSEDSSPDKEMVLNEGDEVAIIPPVSSG
jgi:molybdopterin converting factor small subunit